MNRSKIAASVLAVSMLAGVFTGCAKTTKITTDQFEKACGKLKLEEVDVDDSDAFDDEEIFEDGFYFILDEDDIEMASDSVEDFLKSTGLDDVLETENILAVGAAAKCDGIDTVSDLEADEIGDIEFEGAAALQITLDDAGYVEDIMECFEDMLDTYDLDVKSLSSKEFYSSSKEGYLRFHIDVAKYSELVLDNDDVNDLADLVEVDLEDYIGDLKGDIAVSVEIRGENVFVIAGWAIGTKATIINDFSKAFGAACNPMSIPMNEKFAESMIDSLVDTAGRLVTGVISGGDDVDPGDGGVGDDTDDDDPGDDPGDDAITTGNAKGKVGVSMPSKDLQRWNQDGERLRTDLKDAGCDVDLQYASNDTATQIQQIQNMIYSGCDVIIVAAIDGSSLSTVLELAADKNVTVIAYDRLIYDTEYVDYYVTFDQYMVGVLQAGYIINALDADSSSGTFNIELTAGDTSDFAAKLFYQGAYDALLPYIESGKFVVVSGQTEFEEVSTEVWNTEIAKARAENIIGAYYSDGTNIDAWLCSNDSTALGVTQALEKYYKGTHPIITGQDCELVCVKNIINGKQAMSVFKDTRTLCDQTVKMTVQILNGEAVDVNDVTTYHNGTKIVNTYLCPPVFVDVNNYKTILIDSGYYTASDLG